MPGKYSGRWTANLDANNKQILEEILSHNNKVLDRLVEMCYNMIKESEDSSIKLSSYDSPNWAYRQADSVGYRRGLEQIIQLCSPAKERDPA